MESKPRTCQHPGCTCPISARHLMCTRHWQNLSPDARTECQRRLKGWGDWDAAALWLEGYYTMESKKGIAA
jgi:hypothetical protein